MFAVYLLLRQVRSSAVESQTPLQSIRKWSADAQQNRLEKECLQCALWLFYAEARLSNAPQLHKVTDTLSLLVDSNGEKIFVGGLPLFLIDENGTLVQSLEKWLEILVKCLGNTGNSLLPGLFINGLIKVSKFISARHSRSCHVLSVLLSRDEPPSPESKVCMFGANLT